MLTLNTLPSGTLSARSFVKFCRDQTLNESENHRFVHMCLTKTNENIRSSMCTYTVNVYLNVSVQGVVAILQHYSRSLIFMNIFFFIINFQKEKANTLTLLIILIVQSLQIELFSTNLLL